MKSNWAEKNKQVTNKRPKAFYSTIGTKNSAGVWGGWGVGGGGGGSGSISNFGFENALENLVSLV